MPHMSAPVIGKLCTRWKMKIFKSEQDLIEKLEAYEGFIVSCAQGEIDLNQFLTEYDNFYFRFALDGHESDEEEKALLSKYASRITLHEVLANEILGKLCSENDAQKQSFIKSGRLGPFQVVQALQDLVKGAHNNPL